MNETNGQTTTDILKTCKMNMEAQRTKKRNNTNQTKNIRKHNADEDDYDRDLIKRRTGKMTKRREKRMDMGKKNGMKRTTERIHNNRNKTIEIEKTKKRTERTREGIQKI